MDLAVWGEQVHFGEHVEVGKLQQHHGRHGLQTARHKLADLGDELGVQAVHHTHRPPLRRASPTEHPPAVEVLSMLA